MINSFYKKYLNKFITIFSFIDTTLLIIKLITWPNIKIIKYIKKNEINL